MTSGELPGWGPPPPPGDLSGGPYGSSYTGPWGPAPVGPTSWTWTGAPGWPGQPVPVSDDQLLRLPPPVPGIPGAAVPISDQRPAVVGLAVSLAVTASLLWVCGLSLFGLVALAGIQAMSPVGEDGVVFHTLDEFVLRMGDGLWVPLYGFPVAAIVTAFLLLNRRPWSRLAHSAVGVASLGWAAWWLRDSLLAWAVVALYVGGAVALLWVPAVGRWYAGRPARPARPRVDGFSG